MKPLGPVRSSGSGSPRLAVAGIPRQAHPAERLPQRAHGFRGTDSPRIHRATVLGWAAPGAWPMHSGLEARHGQGTVLDALPRRRRWPLGKDTLTFDPGSGNEPIRLPSDEEAQGNSHQPIHDGHLHARIDFRTHRHADRPGPARLPNRPQLDLGFRHGRLEPSLILTPAGFPMIAGHPDHQEGDAARSRRGESRPHISGGRMEVAGT